MIAVTTETLIQAYPSDKWERHRPEREKVLLHYPFSVAIEGSSQENDSLEQWMNETFGPGIIGGLGWQMKTGDDFGRGNSAVWGSWWYGKVGYYYGYWEYFFSDGQDMQTFIQKLPDIYGEDAYGKWYRSEGSDIIHDKPDVETDSMDSERRDVDSGA